MKKSQSDDRVRAKHFPLTVFIITFIAMAVLTTMQNRILGAYIDHTAVPLRYFITMTLFWVFVSAMFTLLTRWQIVKNYDQPMKRLAKATRDVASGDFSVYVRPTHTADKADYIDVMIEDFNKMVAELGSIETLKTEFFSNVSHEIKTPLSVVQNYAELLLANSLTDVQRKEYAAAIIQSTRKLSGLITNILKLNKLEQQNIQLNPERYDLCAQLSRCALQFEEVWEEKEISFEADLEDSVTIVADENLLELVWNNLLSNALKFTDKGGAVTLTQASTADEIIVTVSDTGCGMDGDTLNHIFDKFYQGDTSHSTEGNGLGLSLSMRAMQLSGGTITAKSIPGEGSEFTVHLPVKHDEAERGN